MAADLQVDTAVKGLSDESTQLAVTAESAGFDGVLTPETDEDPFLPLGPIAEQTDDVASAPASRRRSRARRWCLRTWPGPPAVFRGADDPRPRQPSRATTSGGSPSTSSGTGPARASARRFWHCATSSRSSRARNPHSSSTGSSTSSR